MKCAKSFLVHLADHSAIFAATLLEALRSCEVIQKTSSFGKFLVAI